MAIKAIINNTEKEIEQIKNSDGQDIDYVYSRIGDTEVEGEPPINIKSIGGNLVDYRIYGQTVDDESVGDLVTSGEHAGAFQVPVTIEGKNLLPTITETNSKNGILLRGESDGTVIVNGTATANTFLPLKENISYPFDTFLSGCP